MTLVYAVCAAIGGTFVVLFLVGGELGDGGDLDMDADVDFDGEAGAGSGLAADLLSIRSLAFLLTFFGITGLVIGALGAATAVTLLLAIVLGIGAMVFNARLVGWLRRSESDSLMRTGDLLGLPATVVVPVHGGSRGRIEVDAGGRRRYLVARHYRDDAADLAVGDRVVIVEMKRATALVAVMDELGP